jgi:hypothetical protein
MGFIKIFRNKIDESLTELKTNELLLNKISHRFLITTKLFNG